MNTRWDVFFVNLFKDLKFWLFLLFLLCAYRGIFIFTMQEYMISSAGSEDIVKAMWIGFRLSLKSAGALALVGFVFCTLPSVLLPSLSLDKIRMNLGRFYILVLSLLLMARYPYYKEFHTTFNQNIYNTFKEDAGAMLVTAMQEYQLVERFIAVAILLLLLNWLLKKWLQIPTPKFPTFNSKRTALLLKTSIILLIPVFMLFIRFGGSFNYAKSVNWQNAGMTKDYFLNEAILDDIQALYRAKEENEYSMAGNAEGIEQNNLAEFARKITRKPITSNILDDYFIRSASGAKIKKPKHIFVIIGESYVQWPIGTQYSNLNIANGIKSIIAQENAFYSQNFIPVGTFTADTLNGLVTGMAVAGIYPAYQAETYKGVYGTAFAKQFKNLGYKTIFWHGGYASSGKIKDLVLAQGFDDYVDCGDMDLARTNVWGAKDGLLLQGITERFNPDIPTVHVILTVINHPPYNLDVDAEGFDREKTRSALPKELQNDNDFLNMLGCYWYMDREITTFVQKTYQQYPDSLFVITGDHADRRNIAATPSLYDHYTIPFVLYGQGVTQQILSKNIVGTHLNIAPTLIELIAPQNYSYSSIVDSFTESPTSAFSQSIWMTDKALGRLGEGENEAENLPSYAGVSLDFTKERQKAYESLAMRRTLSWWRVSKGNIVKP